MEMFLNIMLQAIHPYTLLLSFVGVNLGLFVGAVPGLGVVMAMTILLPFTFSVPPLPALTMLASIYVGGMSGDVIPAVLFGIPGTPGAAADVLDGHPLAKQGRANEALNLSIFGSFIGGIFSALTLLLFSGPLVAIAVNFGPPEYFWMALCGLSLIATLSREALIKGLFTGAVGVGISMIGIDAIYGTPRFTFGNPNLIDGIPLLPPLLGLFAFSRVLEMIQESVLSFTTTKLKLFDVRTYIPSLNSLLGLRKTFMRSAIIGTFVGILPGAGADIAAWVAYGQEKRASKTPEKFGTGAIEGLVAAETANSAVTGGSMLPLLALGIPGSASAALMYAGITVQGIGPGLELFTRYKDLVYALICGFFLANIMTLVCCLLFRNLIAHLLTLTPNYILTTVITITSIIGAYTIQNNMFHVYLMLLFGALGYILSKLGYPLAPLVLGIILGPMAENGLLQSLDIFDTNPWMIFFGNRGISAIFVCILMIILLSPLFVRIIKAKRNLQL
jgi:putative tricarboxylic transport membrane protein